MSMGAMDARIRRQYNSLAGRRLSALAIQTISAPVFHGHTFSIFIELERPVDVAALEEALGGEHVDLVLEDTDSPSNLVGDRTERCAGAATAGAGSAQCE